MSELHDYDTRSVSYNLLSIPSSWSNLGKVCTTIIGRYIWSDITQPISEKNQLNNCLKKHFHTTI